MHTNKNTSIQDPVTSGQTIPWASFYDTLVNILSFGKARQLRTEISAKAPYKKGDILLDVGCGTGDQALLAEDMVGDEGRVYGSDAASKMINVARQKAQRSNKQVNFDVDVIENLSHADETFDVVMNSLVMHHLPGDLKRQGIKEFYRVLKTGGSVYIVDMEPDGKGSIIQRFSGLMIHLHGGQKRLRNNVQQLIPLLEDVGFQHIKIGRINRQFAYITAIK